MPFNFDSREAALEAAINKAQQLNLNMVEQGLNAMIQESWEIFNLTQSTLSPEEIIKRKKTLYQLDMLLLTVCKCNRG